jgi:hypothetical protein
MTFRRSRFLLLALKRPEALQNESAAGRPRFEAAYMRAAKQRQAKTSGSIQQLHSNNNGLMVWFYNTTQKYRLRRVKCCLSASIHQTVE